MVFAFASVFVLFKVPITEFFTATIVANIACHVKEYWVNDVVFGLLFFYVIIRFWSKVGNYSPSKYFTLVLCCVTAIYGYYRFFDSPWSFESFSFSTKLYYTDILIALTLSQVFLCKIPFKSHNPEKLDKDSRLDSQPFIGVKRKKQSKKNTERTNKSLVVDESIGTDGIDKLQYSDLAKHLVDIIFKSSSTKAFALGINARWGKGKTSFIDLIKREVRKYNKNSYLEVDFEPWKSDSPQSVVKDFFEQLQIAIRPYHSSLSWELVRYSEKLVSIKNNTLTQLFHSVSHALNGLASKQSMYDSINTMVVEIKRKIIVYIDDLDRLDKSEVYEVLRLIRNTANFQNTVFITAYDRDYIVEAIEYLNPHRSDEYLNKIFQTEISLPFYPKERLKNELIKNLKEKFPVTERDNLSEDLNKNIEESINALVDLDKWLHNLRDINRLTNALVINMELVKYEVDIVDFLRIELLRLRYPSVYSLFESHYQFFIELVHFDSNPNNSRYHLKNNNSSGFCLTEYLTGKKDSLHIDNNDIERIEELFTSMFNSEKLSPLSICKQTRFENYLSYRLTKETLAEEDFRKAYSSSLGVFQQKIKQWIDEGLYFRLVDRFSEITEFKDKEEYEKCITAIFFIARIRREGDYYLFYPNGDLWRKVYGRKGLYRSEGEFKNFFASFFDNAQPPYLIEASFLFYLSSHNIEGVDIFSSQKYISGC